MLKVLRFVGIVEGLSFLVLLGIAMPLKYIWGMPKAVSMVGMAHGVLFVGYYLLLVQAKTTYDWPLKKLALGFLAAILPFGTFIFDKQLKEEDKKTAS